jgi:hypothetical protein
LCLQENSFRHNSGISRPLYNKISAHKLCVALVPKEQRMRHGCDNAEQYGGFLRQMAVQEVDVRAEDAGRNFGELTCVRAVAGLERRLPGGTYQIKSLYPGEGMAVIWFYVRLLCRCRVAVSGGVIRRIARRPLVGKVEPQVTKRIQNNLKATDKTLSLRPSKRG